MSELFNSNCLRMHSVLPGLGSKCGTALFCASDLGILSYLLWSHVEPPAEESSITSTVTTSPPCQSSQSWGHAGGRARSVCAPVHVPATFSLSCPTPWGTQGSEPSSGQVWGSCCASKWSGWESCSYPEIRSTTDNGSPSSSHIPVKGTLFLNNLRNI